MEHAEFNRRCFVKIKLVLLTVCVTLAIAIAGPPQASSKLSIIKIDKQRQGDWVLVDNGWSQTIPRLKVSIRSLEDIKTADLVVKAYFYDKDKKLLKQYNAPAKARHSERGTIKDIVFEEELQRNKEWPLYFPITNDLETAKWQTVLIVLSDGQSTIIRVFPGGKPEEFEFDEKATATSP